ncbi:MAG: rane protein [Candidatus Sulfotelmatobacter sp.]|nr:rane protein [Candidatus Sulfotelmatobacter sp.]
MDSSQNDLEAIRRILAELTARVYRIEHKLGIEPESGEAARAAVTLHPPPPTQPVTVAAPQKPELHAPPPLIPQRVKTAHPAEPHADLESRIGSHWLNRIGIAALLIGVSYFLKFAFDNNWIGPAGRVSIGILAGIAVVVWSERFRAKGYQAFSYSLKAVGIGTLYLSLWAAFQVYSLIPSSVAFGMMLAVTAATAAMALAQDAQLLAAFALTGGFTTPVLLSTGQNREVTLFCYVALLDLATLFLVVFKPWRRLLLMSYAGTLLLYLGWYFSFYNRSQLGLTLAFATLFFAIFAISPLVTLQPEGESAVFASITAVLAFVNAVVYFLQAYAMVEEVDKTKMAWFALALAAVYIFLSRQVSTRKLSQGSVQVLHFLHLAVALGFITVAIPIRLDAHWITIGWFVEAGILLWVADRIHSELLNIFALAALVLGVARLLLIDNFYTTDLIFNMRMATYTVAVVVLGAVAWYASRRTDEAGSTVAAIAVIGLNALALMALSHEVADYYSRQMPAVQSGRSPGYPAYAAEWRSIQIERDFTYSALWMAYGAMLMVVGFFRRSAFVRWQALVLIAATVVKVFVYDVSQLDRGYRIVSFIVLGALLLAISFVYQKDWLQLSAKKKLRRNEEGNRTTA